MVSYSHSYTGICPYCQFNVHFSKIKMNIGRDQIDLDPIRLSDKPIMKYYSTEVAIVTCDNCGKKLTLFFGFEKTSKDSGIYKMKSTFPVISKITKPDGVSQRIWDDYVEAMICLGVNAPKGAVVLLRRATQSLMKELGANPKNRLRDQIEELRNNSVITEELYHLATELRLWGNFGAHPDEDLLDEVTIDEANEMKNIFDLLLNFTVIQKEKIKKIQEKRKQKKS